MPSSNKHRKISDKALARVEFFARTINARNKSWRKLSQKAVDKRAVEINHSYLSTKLGGKKYLKTSHMHGEFKKRLIDSTLDKHNISTSISGNAPRSFPKILEDLSKKHGASDVLRVLKGTHLTNGIQSTTADKRIAAVELASEIGISEYARGSTSALFDAAINLYRIKRGKLAMADFADHTKGYTGAGEGGAARLRALGDPVEVAAQYKASLKSIYRKHASKKAVKPWEEALPSTATSSQKYMAWLNHKFQKWTQREGEE